MITVFSFGVANATEPEGKESVVKILPSKKGSIKVLYINASEKKVDIRIYGHKGLIIKDQITSDKFDKGFVKIYNLNNLKTGEYFVEITDSGMSIKYPISIDKKGSNKVWAKHWDKYEPQKQVIASNKG